MEQESLIYAIISEAKQIRNAMELSSVYQPNELEPTIYAMWEMANAFEPSGIGEPYSIVMPPPNANGDLHVGHALTVSLQDILVRYYRMRGRDAIYIPGADHAGFETWVVYERELNKQGKTRFDFSREELYNNVWNFVAKERGDMELQLRALGVSSSWKDLVFTLDPKVTKTVYSTFKKLWDEGLIYRGERIVNYSTKYQTSYADIEVNYKQVKGKLYSIAYPLIDKIGEIIIATTRPETILGDTAIAVNPKDERYKDLIGKTAMVPITNREIPIIADDYVDPDFGTGAVKITPAHDPNDFEIGERHNLERVQVIDSSGKMINVPDSFMGLTTTEAREKIIAVLKSEDAYREEKEIVHVVGFDYKSDLPIEPMLKEQWFLKIRPLAERAKVAIENDEIKFYPRTKKKVLIQYLDNLRDWNLSRQIAWGIPIPAFVNKTDSKDWIYDERVDESEIEVDGKKYIREEDTFDTWFSSGQWPFITTDYLENGKLARFYPTTVMETGADLLDRWVARMIMLGLYVTDKVPFKEVYLHGMVLDEHAQKMSKSKGNVINPISLINQYGSDALRMGIVANRSAGQNQALSTAKVIAGRNFCNKLWNVSRFVQNFLPIDFKLENVNMIKPITEADHWIISRLNDANTQLDSYLTKYRFSEANELIYHTIWDDMADWYLESSKKQPNYQVLVYALETCLKLAHPFAPFLTEAIWQSLPWREGLLIKEKLPEQNEVKFDAKKVADFTEIIDLVSEIRYINNELPGNNNYQLLYKPTRIIDNNIPMITHLGKLKEVIVTDQPKGIKIADPIHDVWLNVDEKTLYKYQSNLEVRLLQSRAQVANLARRLENPSYLAKAPKELVKETEQDLQKAQEMTIRLENELKVIS